MAIKVQGTTVIDDSRNIINIGIATVGSLDVNKISSDGIDYGQANYVLTSGGPSGNISWKVVTDVGAGILDSVFIRQNGSNVGNGTATTFDFYENFSLTQPSVGIVSVRLANTLNIGGLNVTGISTFTDAVNFGTSAYFGDNDSLYFGDGNDLRIYHDGSNTYINNTTGSLYITDNGNNVYIQGLSGESSAIFRGNAAVELYYDNVKEFETTGYGATVFGTLQTQQLNVSGVSTFAGITTVTGNTLFAKQLNVSGVATATTFIGSLTGTATSTTNIPNLSGDVSSNNTITTLATVNSNVGTYGGTGAIPVVTVNAKGLVTGVSTVAPNNGTLTLAVSGTGLSGSASFTANQSSSSTFTVTSNATSVNTNNAIVSRNASGGFSAGIITATQFSTGSSGVGVNITTNTISGPAELTIDPAAVGDNTGSVRIKGDLYVDGTQFIVNSSTIELADFNVGIATTVGTNALLDGAGIGIGSTGIRKTITWNNTAGALTSSEDWNLVSGKQYEINGTSVLNATTLGSGVVNSSLTSVGTLGQLNVSGNLGIGTTNPGSTLAVGGTITELYNGTYWNVVTQADVGYGASQVPLNQYLGQLAFLDDYHPNGLRRDGGGSDDVTVNDSGFVGIGTTNATATLDVRGNVNITGVSTFQGNVYLGDNDNLYFGDGNDLRIYHNGTDSSIDDQGSGNLQVITNGASIRFLKSGGENLANFNTDGSVELYYDNSKKFETTSSGILVTGDVSLTSELNFSGSASKYVDFYTKDSGGTVYSANLRLVNHDSSSFHNAVKMIRDGAVELYHNNSKKLETTDYGIYVTGAGNTSTIGGAANLVLDPSTVGDNTGTVTILGNLQVEGTQTIINSTTLEVDDKLVSIAKSATNATQADGAGLEINGASATLTYASTGDKWVFNKAPYYNTNRILTTADEGTGNGLDADTLDGIDSGSFLRSDADDITTGQIQITKANNTATGGGQIYLNGATGNRIDFNQNGVAAPAFTTRSAGTKIVLYQGLSGSQVDYAFGIETSTLWYSVPNAASQHRWYAGTTQLADLKGTGELVIGSTSLTGTSSQRLQVTGGAYVSTALGIGRTNPGVYALDANGVARIGGASSGKVSFGTGMAAGDYGISILPYSDRTELQAEQQGTAYRPLSLNPLGGNVGVGTTNPGATLNVVPTSTSIAGLFSGTTSSDMVRITQTGTGNALVVEDETNPDTSSFVIANDGKVGIGITNPGHKLVINGGLVGTSQVRFVNSGNGDLYINHSNLVSSLQAAANIQLALGSNNVEVVRINNSSQVGVGTTNPQDTLDVGIGTIRLYNKSTLSRFSQIYQDGALTFKNSNGGDDFNFYVGNGLLMRLYGGGQLVIGASTLTGTASQSLQVTGGAYVSGSVGIGTTNPQYKLHVVGSFGATTKSFIIDHPTKQGKKLQYGSLEGPENGVYVRGRTQSSIIELPEYWTGLVDETSITVNLTPIGRNASLHSVIDIVDNTVVVESASGDINCFYTVFAERKDVEKLEVEF